MRCWPTESIREKIFCAEATVSSVTCWISSHPPPSRLRIGLAHDHMQANADDSFRPARPQRLSHDDLFGDLRRRLAQVRYLSTVSTATSMPASDDPPKYSGGAGDCTGWNQQPPSSMRMCLPSTYYGLTRQQVAVDVKKLARQPRALVMVQKDAVALFSTGSPRR